jgi:starvation-inducible DNA-binding protein
MNHAAKIPNQNNEVVSTFLNLLLADEYVLYTKTRAAHWNVDGSNYFEVHVFLENQFNTLDYMVDEIAEQIRSLGHFASGSLKDFLSVSKVDSDNLNFKNSKEIFEMLRNDHDAMISMIQHEIGPISKKLKDQNTANFIAGLMEQHKKMVWMIRSFLSEPVFIEPTSFQNYDNLFADRNN